MLSAVITFSACEFQAGLRWMLWPCLLCWPPICSTDALGVGDELSFAPEAGNSYNNLVQLKINPVRSWRPFLAHWTNTWRVQHPARSRCWQTDQLWLTNLTASWSVLAWCLRRMRTSPKNAKEPAISFCYSFVLKSFKWMWSRPVEYCLKQQTYLRVSVCFMGM